MPEYVEPDFQMEVESVVTIFGVRWFGVLSWTADRTEAWRSPPYVDEADARRAVGIAFFDNTDR